MVLATIDGWDRRAFWQMPSEGDDIRYDGAPFRLNDIMSRRQFDEILEVHKTSITPSPAYKYNFQPIEDFMDAWNANMECNFSPS